MCIAMYYSLLLSAIANSAAQTLPYIGICHRELYNNFDSPIEQTWGKHPCWYERTSTLTYSVADIHRRRIGVAISAEGRCWALDISILIAWAPTHPTYRVLTCQHFTEKRGYFCCFTTVSPYTQTCQAWVQWLKYSCCVKKLYILWMIFLNFILKFFTYFKEIFSISFYQRNIFYYII